MVKKTHPDFNDTHGITLEDGKSVLFGNALIQTPEFMDWINQINIVPSRLPAALGLCGEMIEPELFTHRTLQFDDEIEELAREYAEEFPHIFYSSQEVLEYVFGKPSIVKKRQMCPEKTVKLKQIYENGGIKLKITKQLSFSVDNSGFQQLQGRTGRRKSSKINPALFKLCSRVVYAKYMSPRTINAAESLIFFTEDEINDSLPELQKTSSMLLRLNEAVIQRGTSLATLAALGKIVEIKQLIIDHYKQTVIINNRSL